MGTWLGGTEERPARFFDSAEDFRAWLAEHHATETELWMGLTKKHVVPRGLTWDDAVPEALCYGWIDSVAQRIDLDTTRQRWTPRKPTSNWSTVNVALVEGLIASGRMQPAGLAAFERRRPDRTGIYAYERPPETLPEAYEALLRADPSASAFFYDRAPAGYRRICVTWVLSAKQEATRDRRMAELVDDCAHGRLIKSQRYGEVPRWALPAGPGSDDAVPTA